MTPFAQLFAAVDATTSTLAKVEAMRRYFTAAEAADAAWAVFFLAGRRLTRLVPARALGEWAMAATAIEPWLFAECSAVVGDGAETAALIFDQLAATPSEPVPLATWMATRILPLRGRSPEAQRTEVIGWVRGLPRWERFTLLKLLTGELRVGVSQTLVVRALAEVSGLPATIVAARLAGEWTPTAAWYGGLVSAEGTSADRARPYPFALAAPVDPAVATPEAMQTMLGPPGDWHVEWKWDGIRAQIVRRDDTVTIWSRGDEVLTARFPEVRDAAGRLPAGTVLDGELLAWRDGRPLPFSALQQRIGRERHVERTARSVPVVFVAYDVLESGGRDLRALPLSDRRPILAALVAAAAAAGRVTVSASSSASASAFAFAFAGLPFDDPPATAAAPAVLQLSERVSADADSWAAMATFRAGSRSRGVEGLMLKRLSSPYSGGRRRGDWWKWKIEPYTVDAVLIYAQPGSGKRASLLTDYTFGLWDGGALVPVAKAYSGLSNDEIGALDRWIRRHTVERFGPVRHVEPVHVVELGFEAIARSPRHRSGVAVRFPRIVRLRPDKQAHEADTLDALKALIEPETVAAS